MRNHVSAQLIYSCPYNSSATSIKIYIIQNLHLYNGGHLYKALPALQDTHTTQVTAFFPIKKTDHHSLNQPQYHTSLYHIILPQYSHSYLPLANNT